MKMLFILIAAALSSGLEFTENPSVIKNSASWQVSFAVSESTDVEISIVDTMADTVVRHLGAGKLGPNAPAPLTASSLSQNLAWDLKDDFGRTVPETNLDARIRAGMSVRYLSSVGANLHAWYNLQGLSVDGQGRLFVYGVSGIMRQEVIRQYDAGNGGYQKTVFPFPPRLASDKVLNWGVNIFTGSQTYAPKTVQAQFPRLTNTLISLYSGSIHWKEELPAYLASGAVDGEMLLISDDALRVIRINNNGEILSAAAGAGMGPSLVTDAPEAPVPPVFCRLLPDGKSALLTGFSGGLYTPRRLYRVDLATGASRVVAALDSISANLQGTAVDDSGRIFVCDRYNNKVRVFDTLGAQLNEFAVTAPELVEVNRATGELYVASRVAGGSTSVISIRKFNGWRNTPSVTAQLVNFIPDASTNRMFMALNDGVSPAVLWFGYCNPANYGCGYYYGGRKSGVWGFRDDGAALTVVKSFDEEWKGPRNANFDRIAVDRRTETVYFNNSWSGLFKVEDWNNPVVLPCSTASGRLLAGDVAVGPDRLLYVRADVVGASCMNGSWSGPLQCYTQDHRHNLVRTIAGNVEGKYGAGYSDYGIAVGYDGKVFASNWCYPEGYNEIRSYNAGGLLLDDALIRLPMVSGGVKTDPAGNIYAACYVIAAGHRMPQGFATDFGYKAFVGSVVKFPPTGGSVDSLRVTSSWLRKTHNALKVYPDGVAPFSGTSLSRMDCSCRSPRFDVDPYGRVYIPNAITAQVYIDDNNGNLIKKVGDYGNEDCKGAGSLVPDPDIGLAWPVGAAASEDFLYITDMYNNRLVRVKMNYALDNFPGLTDKGVGVIGGGRGVLQYAPTAVASITACPNPFNPSTRIFLTGELAKGASLKAFDLSGRLVADLSGRTEWNASGFASGVYLLVAEKRGMSIRTKVILSK